MPLDSNQPLHILDIETSGLSRSGSRGLTSVADFLTASADPASFPRSGFAQVHARSQILQIYASGLPFYQPKPVWNGIRQADAYAHTYIRPAAGYRTSAGMVPFEFSDFTRRTGGLDRARRVGQLSEEQATRAFYRSVEKQIKRNQAVHLYSDLLLHNMGTGLTDGIVQGLAQGNDWRTAPLWGLSQRLFFLHDGRATSLGQAIQLHTGPQSEANGSVAAFNALPAATQQDILNFLQSL